MKRFVYTLTLIIFPLALGMLSLPSQASDKTTAYEVTITNLTRGQSFTPVMVATHRKGIKLFELGQAVSPELAALAEGGDTAPQTAALLATGRVTDIKTTGGLLGPGESVSVVVKGSKRGNRLSLASMLIPTNDAFISLNSVHLPRGKHARHLRSPAYDAGSEPNDERCENIPGPVCGGEGGSPNVDGEGYVHIHAGIHGIGELPAATFDWRNSVAQIKIKRL